MGSRGKVDEVCESLKGQGIDIVRLSFSDLFGIDRGRDFLVESLPSLMASGAAFCRGAYSVTALGEVIPVDGGIPNGLPDVCAMPDLDTLVKLPWEPGVASCLCEMSAHGQAGVEESPRAILRSVISKFSELNLTPIIGPELEFFVLEPDATSHVGYRLYGSELGNVYVVGHKGDPENLLLKWLRQLRDLRIGVIGGNHEFSPGQFEINLFHGEALAAADSAFRFKSAIKELARIEGKLATFMAKPFSSEGGSGFHLHVSANDPLGANAFDDPDGEYGLSDVTRWAMGGVLRHAPALSSLMNPTINSYKRFGPDTLAPWLIDWGLDNRSAMLRIPPERGGGSRLEVRLGDASANPYLAMAGLLAAMYLGITDKADPGAPLEGYGYDPGRSDVLPMSLSAALGHLNSDHRLVEMLGKSAVEIYLELKRNEIKRFEAHVTDWEFREYAYHL